MMVYSYIKGAHPDNTALLLAALLHDVGKPFVKTISDEGKTRFSGHEGYSTFFARDILEELKIPKPLMLDVLRVISLHGVNIGQLPNTPYLSMFRKADAGGRISDKPLEDYQPRRFHRPWRDPVHTVTILIGLPACGKSTYASNFPIVVSRDNCLLEYFPSDSYDEAYAQSHANDESRAALNAYFESYIQSIASKQVDTIIDMTMLSLSDRRSMMAKFPKARFKAVVFLPTLNTIYSRNDIRSKAGKTLPPDAYKHMMTKFIMPVFEEGFEFIEYKLEN
jgi:predicted kinase